MTEIVIICCVAVVICFLITMLGINKSDPAKKKESRFSFALATSVIFIIGLFCVLIALNEREVKPIVVETPGQPFVDTTINIIDGVADTSYIYTFPNYFVE